MRHQAHVRKFGRDSSARRAMFRSLATSLILTESFHTTVQKAKDLRGIVERLVTLGRKDTVHNRRLAYNYLFSKEAVHKLFADLGPRFKSTPGGYTRVVRTGYRHGDAAEMAVIQFTIAPSSKPAKGEARVKKTSKKRTPAAAKADAKPKKEAKAAKSAAKASKTKKKADAK